jgi:hypothetical protein
MKNFNLSKYLDLHAAGYFGAFVCGMAAGACLSINYVMTNLSLLQGASSADYEAASHLADQSMMAFVVLAGCAAIGIVSSAITELKNPHPLKGKTGVPEVKVEQAAGQ